MELTTFMKNSMSKKPRIESAASPAEKELRPMTTPFILSHTSILELWHTP
jgi:hypothetical protein